jgi:hypothetical protein
MTSEYIPKGQLAAEWLNIRIKNIKKTHKPESKNQLILDGIRMGYSKNKIIEILNLMEKCNEIAIQKDVVTVLK